MRISLVAALAENGVIGRGGRMPWHLPGDLRFFKKLTTGHCLVMGRKTFESIGQALPERTSIVVSRQPDYAAEGVVPAKGLDEALAEARSRGESEVFVVGGAEIYTTALPQAERLYLTRVHAQVEGDVFFPALEFEQWKRVQHTPHLADEEHAHAYTVEVWERR